MIDLVHGDGLALAPPWETPGWIICNPPYGERLERKEGSQAGVEQQLIQRCAEAFAGWKLGLLLPAEITPQHGSLTFAQVAHFRNGGIPVRCWSCAL